MVHNKFRVPLLAMALLLSHLALNGQTLGRISGFVKDAGTGEPLLFANLILEGTNIGAASNTDGYYVIVGIPPGEYRLKMMMIGYRTEIVPITIAPGTELRIDRELSPEAIQTAGIIVSGERVRFEEKVEVSRVNLSLREIKGAPALAEADLFRTLQLMPGVQSTSDFSSAMVVRGGSPDENLILLDGIEVYNPFHLGGIFSTFNADALANAEFMAGGFPGQYGNRNSSVLEITAREGNSKGGKFFQNSQIGDYWNVSQIQGEISVLSSKLLAEGPIKNGSWMLAWRRTYYDQIANAYYAFKDEEPAGGYYFRDLHGKVIYNFSPTDRLILATYVGRDFATIDIGEDEGKIGIDIDWGNRTTSLQWRHVPNSRFVSLMSLANTRYDWDFGVGFTIVDSTLGETGTEMTQAVALSDWTLKEKLDWYASADHTVTMGFELKTLGISIDQVVGGVSWFSKEQNPFILALYIQDRWQVNPVFSIQPGLRISNFQLHDGLYYEPRFGLKYLVTENLAFKASWGIYKQFLFTNTSEDAILNFVDFWLPVPRENRAQSAQHYIVGFEQWLGEGFYASIEAYYKPYDVMLDTNPANDPAIEEDDFIEGTGTAYGVEILMKRSSGKLTGWLGYTYARLTKEIDFNSDGKIVKEDGEIYHPKYDQPHTFNLVLSYPLGERNQLGFTMSISSGQPYTPVWGKTYTQSGFGSYTQPYANLRTIPGTRNSARMPTYFRSDISFSREIHPFNIDGRFKFQILNFTNHFNVLLYSWRHNKSPSEVTAISMFPIIPTIGLEFKL